MQNLKNQWALVTGASSGIGEIYAWELAKQGVHLVLVARRESLLEDLAAELRENCGVQVDVIPCDLSDPEAPRLVFNRVQDERRPIRILVNNAGMSVFGRFDQTSLEANHKLLMLNVNATVALTRLFLPEMVKYQNGLIINVCSLAAFRPMAYISNYAASKAFVLSFSEALWAELRETGVKVLAVCPGAVDTPMTKGMDKKIPKATPVEVVQSSLKALEAGRCFVIPGAFSNQVMAHMPRFFTRAYTARFWEKMLRRYAAASN
jgi:uncharacterized protein